MMRFGYWLVKTASLTLFRLGFGLKITGLNNIPRHGRIIIASNHRSDYDPPLLGGIVPREMHFFAKEELFRGWFGRFISYLNAFPVKRGQMDREALSTCLNVLKSEGALIFFPEGTRAPEDGYLRAKLGIGWVVALSDAPVVPVYLHGTCQKRPRLSGRPGMYVVFGKPIPVSELSDANLRGKELYQSISDRILERIRELSLTTPHGKVTLMGPIYDRDTILEERLR